MAQVFVVVAAGSVIVFIIRDLGNASIAGWIIQVRKHSLCTLPLYTCHADQARDRY